MVKRIEDEFTDLKSPMGRLLARRKAKGLCAKCGKAVTERKRTTGKLYSECRPCLEKKKELYDKTRKGVGVEESTGTDDLRQEKVK